MVQERAYLGSMSHAIQHGTLGRYPVTFLRLAITSYRLDMIESTPAS